ncbi:MAG: hypothetical protein IPM45_07190 [Acidimicrobiales bacterium]|nr:hypothetical protein [Acidimicrobiales bacterium]
MSDPSADPVRAQRARMASLASYGQRIGYLLFGVAVTVFVLGFIVGFTSALVTVIVASLVVGSVILAPAIVVGYAARAAEREDRERGL